MTKLPDLYIEDDTYEYVPTPWRDLPPEKQAVFILKKFTLEEWAKIENASFGRVGKGKNADFGFKGGDRKLMAYKKGLVGWRNWIRPNGEEVPFTEENKMNHVALELVNEIATKLLGDNTLSEEEEGNSAGEV